MQRVLVTGATGFIGGHLAEALTRNGVETRCLVRPTSDTRRLSDIGVTLVEGDITEANGLDEAVANVDLVFHLAGLTTALSKAEMSKANAVGPGLVAAACARLQTPPAMIVLSSVAAAGPTERDTIRVESDPVAPVSNYGHSKRAGELAAAKWADRVPLSIIRPGIIFGPRDRLALPIFKTIATWRIHPVVGMGRTKLALLHVDDLVDLLLKVAYNGERLPATESDPAQPGAGVYFVSHDSTPSYRELGLLIARAMSRRVVPIPLLPPVAWSAAAVSQLWSQVRRRSDAFNIDKIREAVQSSWAVSNEKAKRQFRWKPRASLEEQLQDTVQWYEANQWIKIRRLLGNRISPLAGHSNTGSKLDG
ncbi:MAG: NAD-dependent epimerase/dehydratase family protein [Pirellulales bacterium]